MAHMLAHNRSDEGVPPQRNERDFRSVGRREYARFGAAAILTLVSAGQVDATSGFGGERRPETDRSLQIHGSGTASTYEFTVGGRLEPAPGSSADAGAGISGCNAEGAVIDGNRCYRFTGALHALTVNGDASISLDEKRIVP